MYTGVEIIELLQSAVKGISSLNGVGKIILFGSFAKNQQTITSDVDIAVVYTCDSAQDLRNTITLGLYEWYNGDVDIQITYIPNEAYMNDKHELNVAGSVRKDGIVLWQQ